MGANDAAEMLEVAKQETVRLERALTAAHKAEIAIRSRHALEQFGDCVECGQKFPCVTVQILDTAAAHVTATTSRFLTETVILALLAQYGPVQIAEWIDAWFTSPEDIRSDMEMNLFTTGRTT